MTVDPICRGPFWATPFEIVYEPEVVELIPLLLEAFGQKLQWADNFNASVVNYAKIATPE